MYKFYSYLVMITGIMVLFWMSGAIPGSSVGYVMGLFTDSSGEVGVSSFVLSDYWLAIVAAIGSLAAIGIAGAIRIGGFGFQVSETVVAAGIAGIITFGFISDLTSIYALVTPGGTLNTIVSFVLLAFMIPFLVGYGLAAYDWVRGRD